MAKQGGAAANGLQIETVTMDQVPPAPVTESWGKWHELYRRVEVLGMGERNAIKVRFEGQKQFTAARARLRKLAEAAGKRLLSSRSDDFKVGYFWLVKPE